MTDADFSSAAAPDTGASPSPPAPADAGAAVETNSDGNQFSGGETRVADHAAARDASDRKHFPRSADGPIDLDTPAEWQKTPEAGAEVEALVKQLQKQQQAPPQPPVRPERMPRNWSNEEIAEWNALTPVQQERLAEREAKRERDFLTRQNEGVSKQRDLEAAVQRAESTAWASLLEIQPQLEALGIKSNQDWQRLFQERPQDAQAIAAEMNRRQERVNEFQQLRAEAQQQQQQAQQQQIEQLVSDAKAAWEAQKKNEDAAAMKLIPELGDPAKAPAVQQRCMNYLKNDLGLSEQEISHLWHTDATFHSAKAQKLINDASLWREAQERARNAAPKVPPRPQLGGMNGGSGTPTGDAALRAAAERGDMQSYSRLRDKGARR
jgi:hypothetical protein